MWLWLCPALFLLGILQEVSPGPACRISEFPCRNGRCIRLNGYCDGQDDCGDMSDEPLYCTGKVSAQINDLVEANGKTQIKPNTVTFRRILQNKIN